MKTARLVLMLALTTTLLAFAVTAQAQKPAPQPSFVPKTGNYVGTFTTKAGTNQATGKVTKVGLGYVVQVFITTTETCANGVTYSAGVGTTQGLPLKGRTFTYKESGPDSLGGTATYDVRGSFSSEKAFSGTASKKITGVAADPSSGACETGPVSFKLHKK
jgi:hypothetical protein